MNRIEKDVVLKHSDSTSVILAVAKKTTVCLLPLMIMLSVAPLYGLKNAHSDELEDWTYPFFNAQNTNCAPLYYGPSKSRLTVKWKYYLSHGSPFDIPLLTYHKKILFSKHIGPFYNTRTQTFISSSSFTWFDYKNGTELVKSKSIPGILGYYVIWGDKILYSSHDGFIVCLDADSLGILWKEQLYEKYRRRPDLIPIVSNGKAYFSTTNGEIYSFELNNGTRELIINLNTNVTSQTLIDDDNILFCTDTGYCYCVNTTTKSVKWSYMTKYDEINLPSITSKSILLNTTLHKREGLVDVFDAILVCLRKDDGKELWTTESIDHAVGEPILCAENKVYFSWHCFDENTGKIVWSIDKNTYKDVIKYISTSNISGCGNKIFSGDKGTYLMINAENGDYISTFSTLEGYESRRIIPSYGYLYTTDNNFIYCFENAPDVVTFTLGSKTYKAGQAEKEMDSPLEMIQNKLYISPNYLVESLGGIVLYDYFLKIITCSIVKDTVKMTIDKSIADINGKQVQIDPKNPKVTPIIQNGRNLVPLRFLAASLGCKVDWDADTKTIIITYQP